MITDQLSLIIDARNALYRCVYACRAEAARGVENSPHPFVLFLRQLENWFRIFNPTSTHIMWDAPRKDVWRRKIYPEYKARENNHYIEDISEDLRALTGVCQDLFSSMNVRQYYRNKMEADDLIYSLVSVLHPRKTVIVSTDSDMVQIPYRFNSSRLYEPRKEIIVEIPNYNPVCFKALKGDKADNIEGYRGIGEKRALGLMENEKNLATFLQASDRSVYLRNLMLIDLSLCPYLLSNVFYVQKQLATDIKYDKNLVLKEAMTRKMAGFFTEAQTLLTPFKNLV